MQRVSKHTKYQLTATVVTAVSFFCICTAPALVESVGPNGSNARIVQQQGLTGKGIHIAMLSSGNARDSHEAFVVSETQRAVLNYDYTGKGTSAASHDTQVAGIIVSQGGPKCPACIGVAPGARLHSARISDGGLSPYTIDRALNDLIVNKGCRIVVTGVQIPATVVAPDGTSVWSNIYDYYAEHYDVLFANAAGNSDSTITIFGDSYNGITTGGLALDDQGCYRIVGSISNAGPTLDGRRKPELTAPAQRQMIPNAAGDSAWSAAGSARGETSFSAPHTAGAAALLMEWALQTATPDDDKSLTIKAVLVNTADPNVLDKSKKPTDPDTVVWHSHRGYGRLDVGHALKLLKAERVRPAAPIQNAAGWAYETLGFYGRHQYVFNGRKNQQLDITVTWHRKLTRYSATSYVQEAPRFNLKVDIKSPNGKILFSEYDANNTLRKARLILPEDGLYTLEIRNRVYQQDRSYAMAFELTEPRTE
jgi:hypothetical protein